MKMFVVWTFVVVQGQEEVGELLPSKQKAVSSFKLQPSPCGLVYQWVLGCPLNHLHCVSSKAKWLLIVSSVLHNSGQHRCMWSICNQTILHSPMYEPLSSPVLSVFASHSAAWNEVKTQVLPDAFSWNVPSRYVVL